MIRAADTYSALGIVSYWNLLLIAMAFQLVQHIAIFAVSMIMESVAAEGASVEGGDPSNLVAWLIHGLFCLYLAGLRGQLITKMGGTPSWMNDCICWWCCSCCTAIQEARQ